MAFLPISTPSATVTARTADAALAGITLAGHAADAMIMTMPSVRARIMRLSSIRSILREILPLRAA
jgi:hypothetical protein